jgi:hypothetical protein
MRRRHVITATIAAIVAAALASGIAWAAVPASSAAAPATKAGVGTIKYPKRWKGQSSYTYTNDQTGVQKEQVKETTTVVLNPLKGQGRVGQYQSASGTITWTVSGSDSRGCSWTGSGSRKINTYDLFLQLDISRKPYKAHFSGQDSLPVSVTTTCPDGTRQTNEDLVHPFFLLGRKTGGVPVNTKLTKIAGSSPGSQGSSQWTYTWSFAAAP